jgi:predicted RNase H-like HicB family nuclease
MNMQPLKTYRFSIIIEKDEDGYFAICPELQGCYTQGDTYEEVLENIKDTIRLHVSNRLDSGEKISQSDSVSFNSMEVAVS